MKQHISLDLLGKNAEFRNGLYHDEYLSRINEVYPVTKVLGSRLESVTEGEWTALSFFTMGSLGCFENEELLNAILITSAKKNLWQPAMIDITDPEDSSIIAESNYLKIINAEDPKNYLQNIKLPEGLKKYKKEYIIEDIIYVVNSIKEDEFYLPSVFKNKRFFLPSEEFIKYCYDKTISESSNL